MDTVAADTFTVTIDGREVKVRKGISILQATREAGLYIPNLCNLPHMPPYAGCRMCVVEVEKMPGVQTSCTTMVADGQNITIDSEKLNAIRRNVMELIVIDHPWKCLTCYREPHCPPFVPCLRDAIVTDRCVQCPNNKRCELQDVTEYINTRGLERFAEEERSFYNWETVPIEAENPFIERDQNKCILCTRCTQACNGIRYNGAIELGFRGPFAAIITEFDKPLHETVCEFCGDCAAVCPTSAFMDVTLKFKGREDVSVRSACGHCGVGCGLRVDAKGVQIIGVFGDETNPVNGSEVCVRGRYDWGFIQSPLRIRKPLFRVSRSPQARPQEVPWDRALATVAERLNAITA
ncbi:MAG TPA: 2Fe-2S iron-sulfur cluster-binding protein, partial [Dehalococcoidia bacterium]|nr:2Fe-2S iron-sulfur cluster-binding protein [Dehalococcoidia bacterium]